MHIIGFSGKMGCGKDYIADNIFRPLLMAHNIHAINLAFSDMIKVELLVWAEQSGESEVNFETVFGHKTVRTRTLLQDSGTERRVTDDKIWIRYMDAFIKLHESHGVQAILLTGVRFKNEIDYIRECGGIILRVVSPERTMQKQTEEGLTDVAINHVSETELNSVDDAIYFGTVYNDFGDTNNVREQCERIVERYLSESNT